MNKAVSLIKEARKNVIKGLSVFSFKNSVSINNQVNKLLVKVIGYHGFLEGEDYSTLIISADYYDLIKSRFKDRILSESRDIAAVSYEFNKDVMTTVGVLSSLLMDYQAKDINIIEFYTSYLDVIILISVNDLEKLEG